MKFPNTPQLKEWLERDHPELAIRTEFEIDAAQFHRFRKQLREQGDHKHRDSLKEAEALDQVALFAALTYQEAKKPAEACQVINTGDAVQDFNEIWRKAHEAPQNGTIAPVPVEW